MSKYLPTRLPSSRSFHRCVQNLRSLIYNHFHSVASTHVTDLSHDVFSFKYIVFKVSCLEPTYVLMHVLQSTCALFHASSPTTFPLEISMCSRDQLGICTYYITSDVRMSEYTEQWSQKSTSFKCIANPQTCSGWTVPPFSNGNNKAPLQEQHQQIRLCSWGIACLTSYCRGLQTVEV